MDEVAYKTWWPLHLRVARGETLSVDEQAIYEAGRQQLYSEEQIDGSIEALRKARQQMLNLKAEYEQMRRRYEEMEAQIERLEARLAEEDRQLLGVGER
jgi:uncharacterized protein involved in exopolysaccharide biosynthesis